MTRLRIALLMTLLATPALADPAAPRGARYELQVVAVHRPLDLDGRFTTAPREVFLQPLGEPTGPLDALVGHTLTVVRRAPVPAVVPIAPEKPTALASKSSDMPSNMTSDMPSKTPMASDMPSQAPTGDGDPDPMAAPPTGARPVDDVTPSVEPGATPMAGDRAGPEREGPEPPATPGPPSPADANAAPAGLPRPPVVAPVPTAAPAVAATRLDRVERAATPPVPTRAIETPIGQVRVTAIRGDIVVARVVTDGVSDSGQPPMAKAVAEPPPSSVDLPAVMAGDLARYVHRPPIPPPPPLTAEEKARLEAEQRELERDDHRRKNRPGEYERPVMKWKL